MDKGQLDFNDKETLKDFLFEFWMVFGNSKSWHEDEFDAIEDNVPYTIFAERLNICSQCEYFDAENLDCKNCGCNIADKATELAEECPLSPPKWGKRKDVWLEKYWDMVLGSYKMPTKYRKELGVNRWFPEDWDEEQIQEHIGGEVDEDAEET